MKVTDRWPSYITEEKPKFKGDYGSVYLKAKTLNT